MNIIYALRDPITDEYMYVGKSINGIVRAKSHLIHSHNIFVQSWVESLMSQELEPIIDILEECDSPMILPEKEKFWINKLLNDKHPLFNIIIYDNLAEKHKEVARLNKELDLKILDLNNKIREYENRINLLSKYNSIGELIKLRRKELKLTQPDLAEIIGISESTLLKIEKNKTNPTIDIINKILDTIGMELTIKTKN